MPEHVTDRDRETVAFVSRRHGAWLINFAGPGANDRTEDENFDAASSLATAKRLARSFFDMDNTVVGPFRWITAYADGRLWKLEATVVSEWDRYDDDELR